MSSVHCAILHKEISIKWQLPLAAEGVVIWRSKALIVPSFIGSKIIWPFCVLLLPHFLTDFFQILYGGVSWSNLHIFNVWWCRHLCSSVIGSKVIFWWLSFVRSNCHISWQISFKFRLEVYRGKIYRFWWCCPQCSIFYRVRSYCGGNVCARAGHISWRISFKCT